MNSDNSLEILAFRVFLRKSPSWSLLGYSFAALLCYSAGFALQKQVGLVGLIDSLFSWPPEGFLFCLLILPYYINREFLDEPRIKYKSIATDEKSLDCLRKSIHDKTVLLSLIIWIIIPTSLIIFGIKGSREILLRLTLGIVPFVVLFLVMRPHWPDPLCLTVRYRWFFPALLTCGVPFLVGWARDPHSGLIGLIGFILIVSVFFWISWRFIPTDTRFWKVSLAILSLFILVSLLHYPQNELIKACKIVVFGILITIVMAISESWYLTIQTISLAKLPDFKDLQERADKYLAGTNFAASIFPPVFLLTIFYPNTNNNYAIFICAFLILQYVFWFSLQRHLGKSTWFWARFLFGIILPILIPAGFSLEQTDFCLGKFFDPISVTTYGIVTVITFLCGYFALEWKETYKITAKFWDIFKQTRNSVAFTGLLSTFISILAILFFWLYAGDKQRLALFIIFYLSFGLALFGVHLIIDKPDQSKPQV